MDRLRNCQVAGSEAHVQVRRDPTEVARVRRCVRDRLAAWGAGAETAERGVLVASELVTNACVHGRGAVELRLHRSTDTVRIEVIDQGHDQVPVVREQTVDATSGWGLHIVDRLSLQWGVFEGTTHVWADLALE